MNTFLIVLCGISLAFLVLGAIQFIREPRRLFSMAMILMSAGLFTVSLLMLALFTGFMGPLPAILLLLIFLGFFIGYPVLTFFLLANGLVMFRRESRTPGNLLSLIAGIGLVLLPFLTGYITDLFSGTAVGFAFLLLQPVWLVTSARYF